MNKTHRVEGDACDTVVGMNFITIERILKCRDEFDAGDMMALWMFYAKNARQQGTFRVWSTTGFTAKGLGWSEARVRRAKRGLESLNLIEDVQDKDERGSIKRCYVHVFHLVSEAKTHPCEFPKGGKPEGKYLKTTTTGNSSKNSLREKLSEESKETPSVPEAGVSIKEQKPERQEAFKDFPVPKPKAKIVPLPLPSEAEFAAFCDENELEGILTFRPDLWLELHNSNWRVWNDGFKTSLPIRNWKLYVVALNDTIVAARNRMPGLEVER